MNRRECASVEQQFRLAVALGLQVVRLDHCPDQTGVKAWEVDVRQGHLGRVFRGRGEPIHAAIEAALDAFDAAQSSPARRTA